MIALDCVMEYSQGLDLCNRRKSITEYKPCYPKVDFLVLRMMLKLEREDKYETVEELNERVKEMIKFIKTRKEIHIAIVSHSSYLGHYMFYFGKKGMK